MKINSFVGTGILTALSSSVCCMLPAVSLLAGASGMATSFLWLQPYRPYLITLSIISLGIAWYNVLFREKDEVCGCEKRQTPVLNIKSIFNYSHHQRSTADYIPFLLALVHESL